MSVLFSLFTIFSSSLVFHLQIRVKEKSKGMCDEMKRRRNFISVSMTIQEKLFRWEKWEKIRRRREEEIMRDRDEKFFWKSDTSTNTFLLSQMEWQIGKRGTCDFFSHERRMSLSSEENDVDERVLETWIDPIFLSPTFIYLSPKGKMKKKTWPASSSSSRTCHLLSLTPGEVERFSSRRGKERNDGLYLSPKIPSHLPGKRTTRMRRNRWWRGREQNRDQDSVVNITMSMTRKQPVDWRDWTDSLSISIQEAAFLSRRVVSSREREWLALSLPGHDVKCCSR